MANSNNQLLKEIRFDWNKEEILEILNMPLIDLSKILSLIGISFFGFPIMYDFEFASTNSKPSSLINFLKKFNKIILAIF